jgi:F0F1-type ATP synthase delta subunit
MRPTVSQYAQAAGELAAEAGSVNDVPMIADGLCAVLKRRGEEHLLPAIVERLERKEREQKNSVAVVITVAHDPDEESRRVLLDRAQTLFPGKSLEPLWKVHPHVLGGASFRTGEVLYDATIASRSAALKETLRKP